jgi:hypothetical protein
MEVKLVLKVSELNYVIDTANLYFLLASIGDFSLICMAHAAHARMVNRRHLIICNYCH